MLVLERLVGRNFCSLGDFDVPLANQGVIFLEGRKYATVTNKDGTKELRFCGSNGASKTALPDCIRHIFFQSTSRGTKKDEIVRGGAEDGYRAKLILHNTDTGRRFRLVQARHDSSLGSTVRTYEKGEKKWERIGPVNQVPAQKYIADQVIGYTEQEYNGCISSEQGATHILVEGDGAEVRRYLSSLFGVDEIDRVQKLLSKRVDELDKKLARKAVLKERYDEINAKIDDMPSAAELKTKLGIVTATEETAEESITELVTKRGSLVTELASAKKAGRLEGELRELGWDGGDCSDTLRKKEQVKSSLELEYKDTNSKMKTIQRIESLKAKLADLPDDAAPVDIADIKELTDQRSQLKQRVKELEERAVLEQIEFDPEQLTACEDNLTTLDKQLGALEHSVSDDRFDGWDLNSGEEVTCSRCGSILDRDHLLAEQERLKNDRAQLKELSATRAPLVRRIESLRSKKAKKAKLDGIKPGNIDKITQTLAKLKENIFDLMEKDQQGKARAELEAKLSQYTEVEEAFDDLSKRVDELTESISILGEEIVSLEAIEIRYKEYLGIPKHREVKKIALELSSVSDELEATQETKKAIQEEKYQVKLLLDSIKGHLKELTKVDNQLQDIDVEREYKLLKVIIRVLPKLKKRKLRKIVEGIRDVMPRYSQRMFQDEPNVAFVLDDSADDSIAIQCVRRDPVNGIEIRYPVKGMSTGEKSRLNVSFIWTLHDLLRPTKQIDFLCLDEVDYGLDSFGLNALVSLIEERRKSYGTILVISNRAELAGLDADQHWVAVKIDDVSTILTEASKCSELLTTILQS